MESWWTSFSTTETSRSGLWPVMIISIVTCQVTCAPLLLEDPLLSLPLCRGGGGWGQQSSPHGNNHNYIVPPHLTSSHLTAVESAGGLRDLPASGEPSCPGQHPPPRGSLQGIFVGLQVGLRETGIIKLFNTNTLHFTMFRVEDLAAAVPNVPELPSMDLLM